MKKLFFKSALSAFLLGTACYAGTGFGFLDENLTEEQRGKDLHRHPQYSGRSKMDNNIHPRLPIFNPDNGSPISTPCSITLDKNAFPKKVRQQIEWNYNEDRSITFGFVVQGLGREQQLTEKQRQVIQAAKEGRILNNEENKILEELNSLTLVELAREGKEIYSLKRATECENMGNVRLIGHKFNPLYWLNPTSPTYPDNETSYSLDWRLGNKGYNHLNIVLPSLQDQKEKENPQESPVLPTTTRVRGIIPLNNHAITTEVWDEIGTPSRIAFTTHWLLTDKSLVNFNEALKGAKTLRELLQNLIKKDKDAFEPLIDHLKHDLHFFDVPTYKTAIPIPLRKDILSTFLTLREKSNNKTPDGELVTYLFGQKEYRGKKYNTEWQALDEDEQNAFLDFLPVKLARLKFKRTVPQEALASIPAKINEKMKNGSEEDYDDLVNNIFEEMGYGEQWKALDRERQVRVREGIEEQFEKINREANLNFKEKVPKTDLAVGIPLEVIDIIEKKNKTPLEGIIKYVLNKRYGALWNNLGASDQFRIVEDIKDRVEDESCMALARFEHLVTRKFLKSDLPSTIHMLKKKQNQAPLPELVSFLLKQKGYEGQWKALSEDDQSNIIEYVKKRLDKLYKRASSEFEERFFKTEEAIRLIFRIEDLVVNKKNTAPIPEIVDYLLTNDKEYGPLWNALNTEERNGIKEGAKNLFMNKEHLARMKFEYRVPQEFLEDLPLKVAEIQKSGNRSLVPTIVDYLFNKHSEYGPLWNALNDEVKNIIVKQVNQALSPQSLTILQFKKVIPKKFWDDLPSIVLNLEEAGRNNSAHKTIINYLFNQHYKTQWEALGEEGRNLVIEIMKNVISKLKEEKEMK